LSIPVLGTILITGIEAKQGDDIDWKKNLMLATGAFVSMPGTVTAHPDLTNGLRRRRTGVLKRRTTTVPFVYDPTEEQSIRVNIRVPKNKARRVPDRAISRCASYRVDATLIKLDGELLKIESHSISINAGAGASFTFDMTDDYYNYGYDEETAVTVTAKVEVTPLDSEDCISARPLTSFTLDDARGREFLPTEKLDPVLLKLFLGGPIIVK
jgi:hypothetical protein